LVSPTVIASEAKQSRATHATLDCFVASLLAMTAGHHVLSAISLARWPNMLRLASSSKRPLDELADLQVGHGFPGK
jgi:hypothetical protein